MKKIIALALALIMVLSMGVIALADDSAAEIYTPGQELKVAENISSADKAGLKYDYDFTSADEGYKGISLVESVEWVKNADRTYDLVLTIKENLTSTSEKAIAGVAYTYAKGDKTKTAIDHLELDGVVANTVVYVAGSKKADEATALNGDDADQEYMAENTVMYAEDGAGYVWLTNEVSLTGTVKLAKDEKAQVYFLTEDDIDEDTADAIEAYLGEDYDAIVEYIVFGGSGFKADVDFQYDAYAEDPHFFYAWDGEKFVDLGAKFNDDEDVEKYEFSAAAKGIILVTDVEIVAGAEETKNPDTGANDVVGVAAALAVVSLVAAGAVSLKK